jgi:hypothetical protein
MSEGERDRREQQPEGAPVVEEAGLPRMDTDVRRPHGAREGAEMMGPAGKPSEQRMEPRPSDLTQRRYLPPQQPRQVNKGAQKESYLRLTMHAEDGTLTVVGAHEVEGPLDVPDMLITGLVYEVAIEDQRVSMGSLPDVGIVRSFANRDVPDPEGKHGFQQVSGFDFNVRIPRQALSPTALQHLRISLYRLHQAPKQSLRRETLRQQLSEEELSEVARLVGLPADRVAGPARAELERVLQLRFQDKT